MRTLKLTLDDGNDYIFSTLPLTQSKALQKKLGQDMDSKEYRRYSYLNNKEAKGGLSEKEMDELFELQEKLDLTNISDEDVNDMVHIVRLSLSRKHSEFAYQKDDAKDKEINGKIEDLVDVLTMETVMGFALTGRVSLPQDDSGQGFSSEIDLTNGG